VRIELPSRFLIRINCSTLTILCISYDSIRTNDYLAHTGCFDVLRVAYQSCEVLEHGITPPQMLNQYEVPFSADEEAVEESA
jgi:hypothetical protein